MNGRTRIMASFYFLLKNRISRGINFVCTFLDFVTFGMALIGVPPVTISLLPLSHLILQASALIINSWRNVVITGL